MYTTKTTVSATTTTTNSLVNEGASSSQWTLYDHQQTVTSNSQHNNSALNPRVTRRLCLPIGIVNVLSMIIIFVCVHTSAAMNVDMEGAELLAVETEEACTATHKWEQFTHAISMKREPVRVVQNATFPDGTNLNQWFYAIRCKMDGVQCKYSSRADSLCVQQNTYVTATVWKSGVDLDGAVNGSVTLTQDDVEWTMIEVPASCACHYPRYILRPENEVVQRQPTLADVFVRHQLVRRRF